MVGAGKLDNYRCGGSLVGWLRSYLRGYLARCNPERSRFVSIDERYENEEGESVGSLGDEIAFSQSDARSRDAYAGEDLQVLEHERWNVAQKCFRNLWKGNTMQAYVMLLKLRFHMSSLEIKDRLGITSTANVDQMFSRAVKRMREEKVKYDR